MNPFGLSPSKPCLLFGALATGKGRPFDRLRANGGGDEVVSARASFAFDVVVFDLDGTLADTAEDLAAALNHALSAMGRETVPPDSVRGLIGHGAKAMLRKALAATGEASEALVEEHSPVLLDYYSRHICDATRPYPGLEAALEIGRASCRERV